MSSLSRRWSWAVVLARVLALALVAGCGGRSTGPGASTRKPERSATDGTPSAGSQDGAPRHQIPKASRVPSPKLLDRRSRTATAPDALGLVKSKSRPPQTSAEVYKAVAPATAIIRAAGGLGSGVIIDPAGWILTNHHVIAVGETEDFRTKVTVSLGKMSKKTGGMLRQNKTYEAFVHKADKLRDIALLKLVDPPAGLAFVPIAKDNPVPGQQVVALGHAGAGMLWALKAGEISALGKLSEQLATLAQFKDDAQGKEASDSFKKYLDERNLGLVIQSTCNILPGDSGGPLVTRSGELIGMNAFSNQDPRTGGLLSFHIHRQEIVDFIKDRPAKPARMVPDPWKDGGGDASYEDVDLDGRVDALVLQGRRACGFCPRQSVAVFIDADQDSFGNATALPPLTEVYEKKKFDAELVYLQIERDAYLWYDTDNDGRHDVLLYDPNATGRVNTAYHLKKDGDLDKDAALSSGRDVRTSLLRDARLHARLQRIAGAAFPEHYVETAAAGPDVLPDPIGRTGNAELADLDGDGAVESIRVDGAFSSRLLIDVDRSSVGTLSRQFSLAGAASKIDAEVAITSQSTHIWVWYDTDDDGRFDLALHAPGARLYVATEAWKVDASGAKTRVPEHVGRKLIRPELVAAGQRDALRTTVDKGFLSIMSATGNSATASFPDPVADHRGTTYELLEIPGAKKGVVLVYGLGSDGYLVDLDQNSLRDKPAKELPKVVEAGKFDAEFAYFQRGGLAWAFYDADGKKGYDVVLYSADPRGGRTDLGFRVDAKGGVTLDASLAGKPLISHTLFQRAADRTKLEKLGKELFGKRALETK